jgi:drug/metabolite transporter (DMT)-like permease
VFSSLLPQMSGDRPARHVVPILCLMGVVTLLSSITPTLKYLYQHSHLDFISLACGRVVIGFLFLASISAWIDPRGFRALELRHILQLTALGILGVSAYVVAAWGLTYTSVTHYALLYSLLPTMTALWSVRRGWDHLNVATGCGILLSWAGCLLAITDPSVPEGIGLGFGFGDALVFLFTVMMSGYIVLSPTIVKRFGVWTSNTTMFGTNSLVLMAGASTWGERSQAGELSLEVAGLVLFIGLATGVVFLLRSRALQTLTPATVGAYHNLIPVGTIVLAHLFLGELLTASTLVGGAIVMAGTELVRRASLTSDASSFCLKVPRYRWASKWMNCSRVLSFALRNRLGLLNKR